MTFQEQLNRARNTQGFLAALDQSGGSTPKALRAYGTPDSDFVEGEESMYDAVHAMRTRIMVSPSFTGAEVLGAILFENTMDRTVEGLSTSSYLWEKKQVIPFLKVDKGLAEEKDGVQIMKPIPGLDDLLKRAKAGGVFGTKMRSVIHKADAKGIKAIVDQQFEVGYQIIKAGLVPILEPEVTITSPDKVQIEEMLKAELLVGLNKLKEGEDVMLKLSLPTVENLYKELIDHPKCVRVVALSGGYPRDEANAILAKQDGMIASFSRALLEGLSYGLTDAEFDKIIGESITSIYDASK